MLMGLLHRRPNVVEASDDDLHEAVEDALRRSGCTFDELAEQARTGRFASVQARLAWVAIGNLREVAGH
jgi:hypothetical protein